MKKWVVQLLSDDSTHVIASTQTPNSATYKRVLPAPGSPGHDEGSTFDIVETVEDGKTTYSAVQNTDRKTSLDDQKTSDQTADDWVRLRASRDAKLSATDFTQIPDAPLTAQQVTDYATYRQELRDLPANTVDPTNPTWPTEPS